MVNYNYALLAIVATLFMCFQINFYFDSVFDKSNRKNKRWYYFAVFIILHSLYFYVTLPSLISSVFSLIMIFVFTLSYNIGIKRKIISTILYGGLLTTMYSISTFILNTLRIVDYSSIDYDMNVADPVTSFKIEILTLIIMFAVIQIIRLAFRRKSFVLPIRYYLLFLAVPFISIYQINILTKYCERNIYYFISAVGLLFLNVFTIYMFDTISDRFQLMNENSQLQRQMDYQDANYEKTVHTFKNIKRIIHDTNQQFLYIDECLKKNEIAAASEHIRITLSKVEEAYQRVNTGNLVIDALVSNTLSIAKANGITIETRINLFSQEINIDRYDFCVVLGNMLDNAMEASKKIKVAEDRYVFIKIQSNETALSIHVLNHTNLDPTDFRTQKTNADFHGIGLTNIARICDKYGGNMTIETQTKTFSNMVVLPF